MRKQNGINLATDVVFGLIAAIAGSTQPTKIMAQEAVEQIKAGHPEITGLEIAAMKSEADGCKDPSLPPKPTRSARSATKTS